MDARPIGVFDSGIGGLSVVRALQRLAPSEELLYFADTAYFPYGPRPVAEVRKRAFAITARLAAANVKMIVVACNTASAAALVDLREAFNIPFVGMVPGVKPATASSRTGRVTILATPGTLDGELYGRVVDEFGARVTVSSIPGDGLAEIVEAGQAGTVEAQRCIAALLAPEIAAGSDTVVLGCTHYHFLAGDIRAACPGVNIVDTSDAIARRVVHVLGETGAATESDGAGGLRLIISGDALSFRVTIAGLGFSPLPEEVSV